MAIYFFRAYVHMCGRSSPRVGPEQSHAATPHTWLVLQPSEQCCGCSAGLAVEVPSWRRPLPTRCVVHLPQQCGLPPHSHATERQGATSFVTLGICNGDSASYRPSSCAATASSWHHTHAAHGGRGRSPRMQEHAHLLQVSRSRLLRLHTILLCTPVPCNNPSLSNYAKHLANPLPPLLPHATKCGCAGAV